MTHKLLKLAAMLLVPLVACEEGTPPVPVGAISGQVSIEGRGVDGVTVTMSTGAATTTTNGGRFSFASVDGGTYTVTISSYPAEASFGSTSQPATIATDGQTATVYFDGTYVRTAGITGRVTIEGDGLAGVTVILSGIETRITTTDAAGQYAFAELRAGSYAVGISGFDADMRFSNTFQAVTVGVGEIEAVSFDGTYVRYSSISGSVTAELTGLSGVTVSLSGIETRTTTTDAAGQYAFAELRAGSYTVGISGFDADMRFSNTSRNVTVGVGETGTVSFDGTYIRTASVIGSVTVERIALGGVTVSISGTEDRATQTDANGQYALTRLRAGTYRVEVSDFGADVSFSSASQNVTVGVGETGAVSFDATYVRTAGITGRVTIEGAGLPGVTVSLTGIETRTTTTDAAGQYAFAELRAGAYTVGISGFDAEMRFSVRSRNVTVAVSETRAVNFNGWYLRTTSIIGSVTVERTGLSGVTVSISGTEDQATRTDANGQYAFAELRAGTYEVEVSDFGDDVSFSNASQTVTVGVGETEAVSFDGTYVQTSRVTGRVAIEGDGLAGVIDWVPGLQLHTFKNIVIDDRIRNGHKSKHSHLSPIRRVEFIRHTVAIPTYGPRASAGALQIYFAEPS